MSEERRKILEMLAAGSINADEAGRLLDALGEATADETPEPSKKRKPKYLHVQVNGDPAMHNGRESVNIKIPLLLLKTGMKLTSLVPERVRAKVIGHLGDKGIDFDLGKLDSEKIDLLIATLMETSIDIDSDNEKVRIFCA